MAMLRPHNLLLIKPGSAGDIIHALPVVGALRRVLPDTRMSWLVKSEWAELLDGHPELHEVLPVDFGIRSWRSIIGTVRARAFDCVVDLQGLFRSGMIARLSGAPVRVGFAGGREGSPWLYTHRVRLPDDGNAPWRLLDMHAVDRNLAVAAWFGAPTDAPRFVLPKLEHDRSAVDRLFEDAGVARNDRLIAVAPTSRQAMKRWPVGRFVEAAAELAKRQNVKIVLLGSPDDRSIVRPFAESLGPALVDLVGKTRIRQLGLVFDRVRLLIANDSGPVHVAAACRVPVLACFGPTNPNATGPYGAGHAVMVSSTASCRPCGSRQCHNAYYLECLDSIAVEEVVERAEQMLAGV